MDSPPPSTPCVTASFPLILAGEGDKVTIISLRQCLALRERLFSMGIGVNDEIEIVKKQQGGAVLIDKAGCRYILGGGIAHKINVARR